MRTDLVKRYLRPECAGKEMEKWLQSSQAVDRLTQHARACTRRNSEEWSPMEDFTA